MKIGVIDCRKYFLLDKEFSLENEGFNTSNIISIIALVVSLISGLAIAIFSAWVNAKYQKKSKSHDSTKKLLEDFYGPILSILHENETIYQEFGPPKFIGRTPEIADAKGTSWNSLKEKIIKPNLMMIREIMQKNWIKSDAENKTHLRELFYHCSAFCEYDDSPNEMYAKYKYKTQWKLSIKKEMEKLMEGLEE